MASSEWAVPVRLSAIVGLCAALALTPKASAQQPADPALVGASLVPGGFIGGRLAHGVRFRAMTYDMLEASALNLAYAATLKLAVGRQRPIGAGKGGPPSACRPCWVAASGACS